MKRRYLLLAVIGAAATAMFCAYLFLSHFTKDTTAPVISVAEGILEISVEDTRDVLLNGVTAMDDRDGDVTASLLVESVYGITDDNVTTVTYAAFDRAGNVAKVQRQVRYTDYHEPRFELSHSLCFPKTTGFDLLDYVGATDALEGDIRRRVRATLVSDTKSIMEVGSHVVRLQVTNSLGDTVEADIPVEIYDPEWYTATVKLDKYLVYLKTGDTFVPERYLKSFAVRGDEINVSNGVPNEIYCHIEGVVNTGEPGIYQVTYDLSKNVNLENHAGRAILIVIVQD